MGAMAISTLAGARLVENAPDAWFLSSLLPFLKGFTIFYWATGTWWIPMLAILAVWRYAYPRFPLAYDPLYWGAVFPLGMYAAATREMARTMKLDFLLSVPSVFIFVALTAWTLTFVGMLATLWRFFSADAAFQAEPAGIISQLREPPLTAKSHPHNYDRQPVATDALGLPSIR